MKQISIFFFLWLIIFVWVSSIQGQSSYLDLDHWAYLFIERLETKRLFQSFEAGSRPYSRQETASVLCQVDKKVTDGKILLTKAEQDLLEQLKGEFCEELETCGIYIRPTLQERHLLSWRKGSNRIHLDVEFGQGLDIRKGTLYSPSQRISETVLGVGMRGILLRNLAFHIRIRDALHRGSNFKDERFALSRPSPLVMVGENVYPDQAQAYLVWKLPWFQLELGRDRVKWGPGYHGNLLLSQNCPVFNLIKLQTRFHRFNFLSLHGFLKSRYGRKYVTAHRLELRVLPWLYLAGSETLIYGKRGLEVQYLNPIMPYHVAEPHLGDRDNNMMSLDLVAFPMKNTKFYFEFFVDDFTTSENPLTYFGNKFAFLVGMFWVAPMDLQNTDLRLEYTRVEPWVYTHYEPINIYENYDQSLGYWSGPNSDDLFVEMNYYLSRDLRWRCSWEQLRKGAGDIYTPHTSAEDTRKRFLSGVVERKHIYQFQMVDQLFRDVFLSLRTCWVNTKNAGVRSRDRQVTFDLLVNY